MNTLKLSISLGCIMLLSSCSKIFEDQYRTRDNQISQLEEQVDHLQETNTTLLARLEDLSIINQTEAMSIKNSLETIGDQYGFIQDLTSKIHEKDSINMELVNNLRSSLIDFDDEDIDIEIKGNAVYVSISDKMMFASASSRLNKTANSVLGKVARVILDNENVNVLVEGHTDSVPINNQKYKDNWDLSVLRATAVVRKLHEQFNIDPSRLTAAGRSFHIPKQGNDSRVGRSVNRRTEIIITPKLDQFFKLLEAPQVIG